MSAQDNLNKVVAGLAAVNAHDLAGFMQILDPGFKLYLIVKPERLMPKGQVSSPQGFGTYLHMLYTALPDLQFQQVGIRANGNMVYQELIILGTHNGPLELPNGSMVNPTGIRVKLPAEVYHTFNDHGGFISSTGYVNLLDVMKQFNQTTH